MVVDESTLDHLQTVYKASVETWIVAIRHEEDLASGDHSVAEIDSWEEAAQDEEDARRKVREAKKAYEDALREKFFHF